MCELQAKSPEEWENGSDHKKEATSTKEQIKADREKKVGNNCRMWARMTKEKKKREEKRRLILDADGGLV